MANQLYNVPDSLAGKNFYDFSSQYGGRGDILAQFAGLDPNAKFTAGQQLNFNLPQNYVNSGENQALSKAFGNPIDPSVAASDAAIQQAKKLRDFNIQSNQPSIQTLQGGKQGLMDTYKGILDSIKGQQQLATNTATTNTANELGRRGITGGGLYDTQFQNAGQQVAQQYAPLLAQTGQQQAQAGFGIDQAIASLQSGNPDSAVQSALTLGGQQQQASQFSQNLAQQQSQFNTQNALAQQAQDFAQKYLSVPGYGIYNTQNNQLLGGLNGLTTNGNSGQIIGRY